MRHTILFKGFLMVCIFLAMLVSASAAITVSIDAPASASAGSTSTITVSANTGGATVGALGFSLKATGPLAFSAPSRGIFATANAFPTFNCQLMETNTTVVCSISGTAGASGSGSVLSVAGTITAGSTGSVSLALSNLAATDDWGESLTFSSTTPKTITIQAAAAACTVNDWDVGAWGACSVQCGSGTQTRTVTKKTTSTCTGDGGKPGTSQNCAPTCPADKICTNNQCVTPPACTASDWSCPTWESIACPESGTKTRTCTLNNLQCTNPTAVKPSETQSCSQPVAACTEGQAVSTGCSCVTPKENVNGRCTSVMTDVKAKLQEVTPQNKLAKISEIALRLKNFFTGLFAVTG